MKRRDFSRITALSVVALTTSGFIRFNGTRYEGDCETTTDILGPFYRPGSPVRNNLIIKDIPGEEIVLRGTVRHKDCVTPFKNAKVELWHCSGDKVYDNESPEFRYRGTTYCDDSGNYKFTTQMPVPYNTSSGNYRPAHFHLMISAPGIQNLVTQLYFTGDPYLQKDKYSASPAAIKRILEIKKDAAGIRFVTFNIVMTDKLMAGSTALDKIIGVYVDQNNEKEKTELFEMDGRLWMKNEVYGNDFEYIGNNTFRYPNLPEGERYELHFEILKDGSVKLTTTDLYNGKEKVSVAMK